jgi:hypothetical protein
VYSLAQLDNYSTLPRRRFPCSPPATLSLSCRASASSIPGTWGFGFWNDPFAVSLGLAGTARRLPVLPNACWFFYSSAENHLSFHDDTPGSGFLMQVFRSPLIPALLLAPGLAGLPLLLFGPTSRGLRALSGRMIHEDSQPVSLDVTAWHDYGLSWRENEVTFSIDDQIVFHSPTSPQGRLGLVLWIDNQFAAWRPDGKLAMGTLQSNQESWLEIKQFKLNQEAMIVREYP